MNYQTSANICSTQGLGCLNEPMTTAISIETALGLSPQGTAFQDDNSIARCDRTDNAGGIDGDDDDDDGGGGGGGGNNTNDEQSDDVVANFSSQNMIEMFER